MYMYVFFFFFICSVVHTNKSVHMDFTLTKIHRTYPFLYYIFSSYKHQNQMSYPIGSQNPFKLPLDNFERRGVKRFEARWLKEETVEEMVKPMWARAVARGEGSTLMQKTGQVHDELHVWDREVLKGPTNRIRKMQKDLEKLRRGPMSDECGCPKGAPSVPGTSDGSGRVDVGAKVLEHAGR